jgi:hypothetical protein
MDAFLQSVGIFTDLSIEDDHPRVELVAFDKGFVNDKDAGKVGYYLIDCDREDTVPVTREQAKALYTLAYPMTWEEWDKENRDMAEWSIDDIHKLSIIVSD